MRHARRSLLLAFDGDELSPRRRSWTARHLRDCDRCRSRLSRLRGIRDHVRDATDVPAPSVLDAIEQRLDAGERLILPRPAASVPERARVGPRRAMAAAVVGIFVAAASVAAATGRLEPMARWILDQAGVVSEPPAPQAGLEVPVPSEGMTVELRDAGPDLLLRVERTDGTFLQVIALGEASIARFSAGARITVTGARTGELLIRVPRSAGPVRVVSGSLTLVTVAPEASPSEGSPALEVRLGDVLR